MNYIPDFKPLFRMPVLGLEKAAAKSIFNIKYNI